MFFLYNPPRIFNAFSGVGDVALYSPSKAYSKDDLIICPIKWQLWSITAVLEENYNAALRNKDFEQVFHGIRTSEINELISKYEIRLLLYNEWECRDLTRHQAKLRKFVNEYLNMSIESVYFSTCDYLNHMKPVFSNVISFDWVYAREKACFQEDNIIKHNPNSTKRIITLNHRKSPERYVYCYYLSILHNEKITFSYLQEPVDDIEKYKSILGSVYSKQEIESFNSKLPRFLDGKNPDQHQTQTIADYLHEAVINVGFETNLESVNSYSEQVSEKTYKGIRIGKPFMIFTTKGGILQHLKRLGFKTFSPLINEEYDNPKLPYNTRYKLLLEESSRICKMSEEEFRAMETELQKIAQYNLDFLENGPTPNIFELMTEPYQRKYWLSMALNIKYTLKEVLYIIKGVLDDRWAFIKTKERLRTVIRTDKSNSTVTI